MNKITDSLKSLANSISGKAAISGPGRKSVLQCSKCDYEIDCTTTAGTSKKCPKCGANMIPAIIVH